MTSAYFLRIMLALLTAVWSPAWCCCETKAISHGGSQTASCHGTATAKTSTSDTPAHCHAADKQSPNQPAPETPAPDQHSACACTSTPADKPATPALTVSSAAFEVAITDAPPHVIAALPTHNNLPLICEAPPPAYSLLRLHCALIV